MQEAVSRVARRGGWLVSAAAVALASVGCGDDSSGSEGSGGAAATSGGTEATGPTSGTAQGGGSGEGGGATGSTGQGSGSTGSGGGTPGNWTALITGEWELGTGEEITSGIFGFVPDRDIFVGAIRPIAPEGTHHTILALGDLGAGNYIYASGVDTNELIFPEGVGLRIPAGQEVILQLHVYNPTPGPLGGVSGIEIIELTEAEVTDEAEIFLPGPVALEIPPQQETTQTGRCTVNGEQNVFALFPHMHKLGTHFKTTLTLGGEETVLHDEPYEFEHQPFLSFEPIAMQPGDTIETSCTWNNTTNQEVSFGESSESEMCFSIMYRWPVQQDQGFCIF